MNGGSVQLDAADPLLETVIKARALVEQGWGQGSLRQEKEDGSGWCYCALGAAFEAAAGFECPTKAGEAAYDEINRLLRTAIRTQTRSGVYYPASVSGYNDNCYTTQQDILDLYDEIINNLKESQS